MSTKRPRCARFQLSTTQYWWEGSSSSPFSCLSNSSCSSCSSRSCSLPSFYHCKAWLFRVISKGLILGLMISSTWLGGARYSTTMLPCTDINQKQRKKQWNYPCHENSRRITLIEKISTGQPKFMVISKYDVTRKSQNKSRNKMKFKKKKQTKFLQTGRLKPSNYNFGALKAKLVQNGFNQFTAHPN